MVEQRIISTTMEADGLTSEHDRATTCGVHASNGGVEVSVMSSKISRSDRARIARRGERAGNGQPDRRVVVGRHHLAGEDVARLRQAAGVERLEAVVDQVAQFGAAPRPVVLDDFATEIIAAGARRAW